MAFLKDSLLLWVSLAVIVAGFVTLRAGLLSVGPLLLVAGYCLGLPLYLWRSFRNSVGE